MPPLPEPITPMLATSGDVPSGPGWAFEMKWDGIRALAYTDPGGTVRVYSRNRRDVTASYPELHALGVLLPGRGTVLDGEIVARDDAGVPSFDRLQDRMHVTTPTPGLLAAVPVCFHAFDLLALDGTDLTGRPYQQRRARLDELGLTGEVVSVPAAHAAAHGPAALRAAQAAGLEGVVAKQLDSPYEPGRRSRSWIKTPLVRTQEVLIIGYTHGTGRRAGTIGSLLLAAHDPTGRLAYCGHVGTGFSDATLRALHARLVPLHRAGPPLTGVPREHARGAIWVTPLLVGEVAYRTITTDGRLRHPVWRGLRPDRDPTDVRLHPTHPAVPAPPAPRIDGMMQTPDGRWQVHAVSFGHHRWYRVQYDDTITDKLHLTDVHRILADAGIAIDQLTETTPAA
ncbi:non-homologous end-joining DNA ligase [Catenuloplanes atrovinosus]|uniref:DNA ligase (ATP) n=1 Tax=Catenuloplanes atrovinosus TaxID=137266 RepID=A0AAE3YQY8_9ACTN|nr:non-homologous end-joining DNA ligase [Catenuloplanes atrovinosus]MDR7277627.1 bifunctional non-homologous end joining protein LigD [Catenuloplanes atrovinosus]